MVNVNADAMAVIFPNFYDKLVPDMVSERLMASIPFGSRYRLIDFILSSFVNCGIDNISILVRENYHSLLDHLGSGRAWDLVRKNGGLTIFPPYAERTIGMYGGRVDAIASIIGFLEAQKEKYVIMSDTNLAVNFNFNKILDAHVASGADVTIAYTKGEIPNDYPKSGDISKGMCYTLDVADDQRIEKIHINSENKGIQNLSMNIYVMKREWLIDIIKEAFVAGSRFFERDVLMPRLDELKVVGYEYTGYVARICSLKSYFDENMKLLDDKNLDALFSGQPIYTKVRDDNPTRYIGEASATNVLVADGCIIEGEIENSILFRGVKIGKGAKVKNCILMQDTVVGEGAVLDHVIADKRVTVSAGKEMKGADSFPVYIAKGKTV